MAVDKSKDLNFLRLALVVAEQSKCHRAHYGTVIVSADGRVVSTGRNGKPRGSKNDDVCYREGLPQNTKSVPNCCIHSEANAIMFSSPQDRTGGTMYVTGVPCVDCTLLIMQSGVSRLVYLDDDDDEEHGHRGNGGEPIIQQYGIPITVTKYKRSEL